jgi:membrane-anchored glycerophosphoryl diester phosphodiesterase (GDPDase)
MKKVILIVTIVILMLILVAIGIFQIKGYRELRRNVDEYRTEYKEYIEFQEYIEWEEQFYRDRDAGLFN